MKTNLTYKLLAKLDSCKFGDLSRRLYDSWKGEAGRGIMAACFASDVIIEGREILLLSIVLTWTRVVR